MDEQKPKMIHIDTKWVLFSEDFGSEDMLKMGWNPLEIAVRGRSSLSRATSRKLTIKGFKATAYEHIYAADRNMVVGCTLRGHTDSVIPFKLRSPSHYDKLRNFFLQEFAPEKIRVLRLLLRYHDLNDKENDGLEVEVMPTKGERGNDGQANVEGGIPKIDREDTIHVPLAKVEKVASLFDSGDARDCKLHKRRKKGESFYVDCNGYRFDIPDEPA